MLVPPGHHDTASWGLPARRPHFDSSCQTFWVLRQSPERRSHDYERYGITNLYSPTLSYAVGDIAVMRR
jgi:hypothetical protein